MISKVEYIRKVGNLKMYVRNNSLVYVRKNSPARDISMPIDSLLFSSWRCGYVEFVLPNGLDPSYIESIFSYNKRKNIIARRIENVIDNASVHGGITYWSIDKETRRVTLGFDCNHYFDSKTYLTKPRSVGYCKTNIDLLLKAILKIKKNYRKILIKEKLKELKK